jgi:DNA-binding NarL/FixJ family response regulator
MAAPPSPYIAEARHSESGETNMKGLFKRARALAPAGCSRPAFQQSENSNGRVQELLTPREQQIARLVAEGLSNKHIGRRMGISEGTVKIHLHNIYNKLDVSNRTSLATLVHRTLGDN